MKAKQGNSSQVPQVMAGLVKITTVRVCTLGPGGPHPSPPPLAHADTDTQTTKIREEEE